MKTKSKSRKKHIPQYFQKKASASTSQLVKIGSYKRRINDLVRNNRRLAVALQEARCEVSSQSKILREYYTRDSKNITLARLKIRDMVKTINTLVCDIDEVKNFLDIDWSPIKEKIMQNRYTSDSKIIKVPSYEAIEEVSISAQEPPILFPQEIPSSSQSSQPTAEWISPLKPCDQKTVLSDTSKSDPSNDVDCILRSSEATPPLGEHEIPAVLFIEEPGGQNNKNKRSTKSKEKSDVSLTPEFDIDFTLYKRKKSSIRRQTLFRSSSSKTSKSSERVASYEQTDPVEVQCETSPTGDSIIQESEIPPSSLTENQGQSENCKSLSDSSPATPCISKTQANCVNDQFTSLPVFSLENAPSVAQKTEVVPQQIECNHTLLLNEDMEFTDIINSCDPILVGKNVSTACTSHIGQRVISNTCSENENNEIAKEENVNMTEALKVNEENASFSTVDKERIFSTKETPFQEAITTNQNNKRNRKSKQKDSSSLLGVRSRHKTVTKYLIFSSDDESGSDYTPSKQTVKKRKCKDRETAIFVADAAPKRTATENIEDCFSQQKHSFQFGNKTKSDDLSVFNFNASFSDKSDNHGKLQKSKLSRNKKSKESKGKEVPAKPLSQTCNVTKLRGFNLKFSKSEYLDKKNKSENVVLPKGSKVPSGSSTSLNHPMEKEILTIESNVNKEKSPSSDEKIKQNEIPTENICNTSLTDFGSLLSPRTILKYRNSNQGRKSEAKRVSFHASDLVCNFTKTSLSKTIANNAKVWQTSKSVVDLEENLLPFAKHAICQEVSHDGILSDRNALDARVNAQGSSFNDSDETEIYKLSNELNDDAFPVFAEVDNLQFLQKVTSNEFQSNKSAPYLGEHNSDKTDVLIKNTDKINTVSSDGKDLLSQKSVVKKKSCSGNKCKQLKTPTSPALKKKNHKKIPQKKRHSSSNENVENNPKINKASKHRNSKILEMLTFNDNCSSEITVSNSHVNNKSSNVSVGKDVLPEKDKILNSGERKKNNSVKKCVQSTPVLRDKMNLGSSFSLTPKTSVMEPQTEEPLEKLQELPKRRSKPICYKEPSLHKKMRRDT